MREILILKPIIYGLFFIGLFFADFKSADPVLIKFIPFLICGIICDFIHEYASYSNWKYRKEFRRKNLEIIWKKIQEKIEADRRKSPGKR